MVEHLIIAEKLKDLLILDGDRCSLVLTALLWSPEKDSRNWSNEKLLEEIDNLTIEIIKEKRNEIKNT
jgi:hypothetical protein